jgi:kynurenine formamidase
VLTGAALLDSVALERFTGPAVVVDVRGLPPGAAIEPGRLTGVRDRLAPGVVVLLATGWDLFWESESYLDHPYLSQAAARELVAAGIRTVGIDAASVDASNREADPLATHLVLAEAGCVIAENLRGLAELVTAQSAGGHLEVSLLPLHLEAGDGSPVRAVATVTLAATAAPG